MAEKCENCGKEIQEKYIKKSGRTFCGAECVLKYEKANKPDDSEDVCEFC